MTQEENGVLYETRGAVAIVTLNRPDKLNSFNEPMHIALRKALDEAAADRSIRALILTGAGRGFCAGQDLSDRLAAPGSLDLSKTIAAFYNPLVKQLRSFPVPVIAAVNGIAAGAGANLALLADIVIAAKSAKFVQAFSKIGLIPDTAGTWMLPKLVGRGKAYALAALAESVDGATAEALGMIWKAVDDDQLMIAAEELANKLAAVPTYPLIKLRELFDASETNDLTAQLELESRTQSELGKTPDYAEGVKSFFEKRTPKFSER
ncbi:MAG: enoyl-CoA hydratase-related protein [Pseudomonadota bacterium]